MIEKFKAFDVQDSRFNLHESYTNPSINSKIEDELWDLIVKWDLDLLIEFPPPDLNVLLEECYNLNEDLQTILAQRTINSVQGARIVTLPKNVDFILSQFLKLLFTNDINLPIKIGCSLESIGLQESLATIITNLYNVFYMDSRKINAFYLDIINNHFFGDQYQPVDFQKYLKTDILKGKKLSSDFISILFFSTFQDDQWYNYAVNSLVKGVYESKNHRIQYILSHPTLVPLKIKVFISRLFWKLVEITDSEELKIKYSTNEIEERIYSMLFFILLHTFWIPYSRRWNRDCYEVFLKLSELFQLIEGSSLTKDDNIKATLVYIRNIIIFEKSEIPEFAPKLPRNELFSSIFSLSWEQIFTLHLWAKSFYKQRYVFKDPQPKKYKNEEYKREFSRELFYKMSTDPGFDFIFLSKEKYLNRDLQTNKPKKKNVFWENDIAIISVDNEAKFDPNQYVTLCKRVNKQMNLLDKWIENKKKSTKTNNLTKLIKVSDALQAVREIRESSIRLKKYTKFVHETKLSRNTLEQLISNLDIK